MKKTNLWVLAPFALAAACVGILAACPEPNTSTSTAKPVFFKTAPVLTLVQGGGGGNSIMSGLNQPPMRVLNTSYSLYRAIIPRPPPW
jgi:hypothetical protein